VLKGERTLRFRKDPSPVKAGKKPEKKPEKKKKTSMPDLLRAEDMPLWEKLRALRLSISRELNIPPFVVFHDRTLAEMVEVKPTTREALLQITGIGEHKAQQYGEQFLELLRKEINDSL
jgi:ATP-dependent DNA helicase RecQ